MADEIADLGSGGDAPQDVAGANPNPDSPEGGQVKDEGGAQVGAEDVAKLNKRIDDLRSQADRERDEFKAREEKLIGLLEQQSGGQSQAQSDAIRQARADLEKRYDDGELTGSQLMALLDEVARDARESALSELSGKLTEEEKERQALKAQIEALSLANDPIYTSHKEQVDSIVEEIGISKAEAIKLVKTLSKPAQPERPALAGGMATPVVAQDAGDAIDAKRAAMLAGIAQALGGRKPTDAEMKQLSKKWRKD